ITSGLPGLAAGEPVGITRHLGHAGRPETPLGVERHTDDSAVAVAARDEGVAAGRDRDVTYGGARLDRRPVTRESVLSRAAESLDRPVALERGVYEIERGVRREPGRRVGLG